MLTTLPVLGLRQGANRRAGSRDEQAWPEGYSLSQEEDCCEYSTVATLGDGGSNVLAGR